MKTHLPLAAACAALLAAGAARAEEARPANAVQGIDVAPKGGAVELRIRGTRAPSYTVFKLQDPPRLVLDLAGADVSAVGAPIDVARGGVKSVSTAQYKDERSAVGRVIVALEAGAKYEVAPSGTDLLVRVSAAQAGAAAPARLPVVKLPPASAPAAAAASGSSASPGSDILSHRVDEAEVARAARAVTGVRARGEGALVELDGEVARIEILELGDPPRVALDLHGVARAPKGAVPLSGAFKQARFGKGEGKVRVVLDGAADLRAVEVRRVEGGLAIAPRAEAPVVQAAAPVKHEATEPVVLADAPPAPKVQGAEAAAAGFTAAAPSYAVSGAPQRREYTGRRITLDFHDIEIRNLLRLIADVSKKNIVVADEVQGKVTVSLRNVPWDQALDLVLKTKGLDKEEMGNVIRVAKAEDIAKEQEARAKAAAARIPLIPLKVRLIPVNFARAADIAPRVKDVLSERGSVTTDDRTNVLIVKDMQDVLGRAEALVRNLDTEIPQVRIESRIVEASSNFNREIGVQWGGNANFGPATGNPTGLLFPNIVNTAGASGGGPTQGSGTPSNYAVNLPAAIGQGSGGGVGFVFGSAGGQFNLNLRLSALENEGIVKTISAPSVSTIDNKEATIGQGISIPFSQVSASGVNTVFIEAKLELKVTPHVTADGSILLKIKVTNNSPNPQLTGSNGQPSIAKREAETEALVKDGETTVIGGIYTRQTANRTASIPWLGKIPLLGFFFRSKSATDDHTELLIFITPRILNRAAAATPVAAASAN